MIRLLRSVLSVKDEFYHRHIVQYNLFAPVFDLFREKANRGVGNNLISSAILEVCFILDIVLICYIASDIVKTNVFLKSILSSSSNMRCLSFLDV